jgi:hypothetical protein
MKNVSGNKKSALFGQLSDDPFRNASLLEGTPGLVMAGGLTFSSCLTK